MSDSRWPKFDFEQVLHTLGREPVTRHTRLEAPKGQLHCEPSTALAHSSHNENDAKRKTFLTFFTENFVDLRQETVDFATPVPLSVVPDL